MKSKAELGFGSDCCQVTFAPCVGEGANQGEWRRDVSSELMVRLQLLVMATVEVPRYWFVGTTPHRKAVCTAEKQPSFVAIHDAIRHILFLNA
jgi:hypothetical protein